MLEMLTGMMGEAIESVLEFIDNPYTMIADLVFHADQYIEKSLGVNGLNKLSDYLLMTGYLLIIIKFLRKILGQYILQMEGDVDVPPSALLERFVKAIIVAVGFRLAYEWGTRSVFNRCGQNVHERWLFPISNRPGVCRYVLFTLFAIYSGWS